MSLQRILLLGAGAILIVFGCLCANYAKPSAVEHHRIWAAEHDAPPPSDSIVFGGLLSVGAGVGAISLGLLSGRGKSS